MRLRLSPSPVARFPRNILYTPGRDFRLAYSVELLADDYPLGTLLVSATLITESSFGLAPLIAKTITANPSASGQITDTAADGIGALYFALTPGETTSLASAPVGFEVIVVDSLGRQATLDLGSMVPQLSTAGLPVDHVVVAPTLFAVQDPNTEQLTVTAYDADGNVLTGRIVNWTSSDPTVATIDPVSGLVTGVGEGSALFTATIEGVSDTSTGSFTTNVTAVTVAPNPGWVGIGTPVQFTATAQDINGATVLNQTFDWSSSDATVATVDQSGLVTAHGASGAAAVITATLHATVISGSTDITTMATGPMATLFGVLTANGDDALALWRPEEFADGATGGAGSQAAPIWKKAGVDAPNMKLFGGASKQYILGKPRIQLAGGGAWFRTVTPSADFSFGLGLAVYTGCTGQSPVSCLLAIQDVADFSSPTRHVALFTDNGTENKPHYYVDYGSPSYHVALRGIGLDNQFRSCGVSVQQFIAGESGNRIRVQRSADVMNEQHTDVVPGRTNWATSATDVTQAAGPNYLQFGSSSGTHIASLTETYAPQLACRKRLTAASVFAWQQYLKDDYGIYEETGEKAALLGDSLNFSTATGQPVSGDNDWSTTTATGVSADLAAKLPAGVTAYCGAYGGESASMVLAHRMEFAWPIMLNARSRSKVYAHVNLNVNCEPWDPSYEEPGGAPQILANDLAIIAQIRQFANANRIVIIWNTVAPAWVDGAANPTDARETTRVAINAGMVAWPAGTVDKLHRMDLDGTIGQPGQNMAGPYYDVTDPFHTHMTQTPGYDYRRTLAAADIAAL